MTQQPPIASTQEMVERLREIADELETTGTVELYDCHLPAITHAVEAASQLAGVVGERDDLWRRNRELSGNCDVLKAANMTLREEQAALREALTSIRDVSSERYDSDRAWALAMQLRAKVALQGWLGDAALNHGASL